MEGTLAQVRSSAQWIGGQLLGGPDEVGVVKVKACVSHDLVRRESAAYGTSRSACSAVDSHGRDIWSALCERIGWSVEHFNVWVAFWVLDALSSEYSHLYVRGQHLKPYLQPCRQHPSVW